MSERVEIRDGDWFVEKDWSYRVRQAIRVSKSVVYYMGEGFSLSAGSHPKERRVRLDKVVFSSRSEQAAKLVAERLISSDDLYSQEQSKAVARKSERDRKIIEAANKSARG